MNKKVAQFTGVSRFSITPSEDGKSSKHVATDFFLEISPNLEKKVYIDSDDLPAKDGIKPLTLAFVHGLIGNIHMAHEKGYWDSAAHLRYIIDELTRGFTEVGTVSKEDFDREIKAP